jgi:hypothetical protein
MREDSNLRPRRHLDRHAPHRGYSKFVPGEHDECRPIFSEATALFTTRVLVVQVRTKSTNEFLVSGLFQMAAGLADPIGPPRHRWPRGHCPRPFPPDRPRASDASPNGERAQGSGSPSSPRREPTLKRSFEPTAPSRGNKKPLRSVSSRRGPIRTVAPLAFTRALLREQRTCRRTTD